MPPVVLSAFTTTTSSPTHRRMFNVGDSIQWNVIHTVRDETFMGTAYRVQYFLDLQRPVIATFDPTSFEVMFEPIRVLQGDHTYRWGTTQSWFFFDRIDAVRPEDLAVSGGRREVLERIEQTVRPWIFIRGLWRLRAIVHMIDSDSRSPIDVSADWYYVIA